VPIAALIVFLVGLAVGGWWLGPVTLALYAIALGLGFRACVTIWGESGKLEENVAG
jgi:hypothetical protein